MLRHLRRQDGIALVMALGMLIVLAIVASTALYYTTQNQRSASISYGTEDAYSLAEAGMADALSVLNNAEDPRTATLLPSTTITLDSGTATYSGTLTNYVWTITSIGKVANPANGAQLQRTLTRQISIQGLNAGATESAWSRIYNDDTTACFTVPADTNIPANVGARGNLCLNKSASITGSSTKVSVGGTVTSQAPDTNQTAVDPAGAGAGWTNSGNIVASDNVKATTSVAAASNSANLDATGFAFNLPPNATIIGIQAKVERAASTSNTLKDNNVQLLKAGAPVGSNKAGATYWGTGDTTITYGTASDLWGTTWTASDVDNSSFGLRFSAHNYGASSVTASVDYVEITVTYNLDTSIGASGSPITEADITGTCKYSAQAAHTPCSSTDHVYASTITTAPGDLVKPTVDFNYWYQNAATGPKHPCDTKTGTPPTFDNNSTYDDSNTKQNPFSASASYTCVAKDSNGNVIGQFSWNNVTQVLTVSGTIFFDSDVQLDPHSYVAHYQGRATIYIAGLSHIDVQLCAGGSGATGCRGPGMSNWDPTQNLLVLISGDKNAAGSDDCKIDEPDSAFQGVYWTKNNCQIAAGADVSGPILSQKVLLSTGTNIFPWPALGSLLPGQIYGSTSTSTDFLLGLGNQSG